MFLFPNTLIYHLLSRAFADLRTVVACSKVLCISNYEDLNVHASHSTGTSEENGHMRVICLRVALLE